MAAGSSVSADWRNLKKFEELKALEPFLWSKALQMKQQNKAIANPLRFLELTRTMTQEHPGVTLADRAGTIKDQLGNLQSGRTMGPYGQSGTPGINPNVSGPLSPLQAKSITPPFSSKQATGSGGPSGPVKGGRPYERRRFPAEKPGPVETPAIPDEPHKALAEAVNTIADVERTAQGEGVRKGDPAKAAQKAQEAGARAVEGTPSASQGQLKKQAQGGPTTTTTTTVEGGGIDYVDLLFRAVMAYVGFVTGGPYGAALGASTSSHGGGYNV